MSLLSHALNAVKDVVEKPVHAVVRALELNFGSGGIGGTNPAEIYSWFHSGPGTGSYETANATFTNAAGVYGRTAQAINKVQQQLASGWSGPASDQAQAQLGPVVSELDGMQGAAKDAAQHLGDQSGTFNDTKNKLTQVPEQPPQGGGLGILNPVGMISGGMADLNVADYQEKAHGNQDAYAGYGQATPPQQAGLPHDPGMAPLPPPDTGVDPGQQGPGISGLTGGGQYAGSGTGSGPGGQYAAPPTGGVSGPPTVSAGSPGGTSVQGVGPTQVPVSGVPGPGGVPGGPAPSTPPIGGSWTGVGPGGGSSFSSPSLGGAGGSAGLSGLNSELGALSSGAAGGAGAGMAGLGSDEVKNARGGRFGGTGARGGGAGSGEGGKAGAAAAAAEAEGRGLASGAKGAGARGAAGEGPMGTGAGRKKDEDEEHKTASYLIHEEHGREVIGEMDGVAPEVIGESPEDTAARHGE